MARITLFLTLFPLLLLGCDKDEDNKDTAGADDTGDSEDTSITGCEATSILSVQPDDSFAYVSRELTITVETDGAVDASASNIAVTDAKGTAYEFGVTTSGSTASFRPLTALPEYGEFTYTLDICGVTGSGAFTTGQFSEAPPTKEISGSTYALDMFSAEWVEPEGAGGMLRSYFSGIILLGVESANEKGVDLILGAGQETEIGILQDPCFQTVDFEPTTFEGNPYLVMGPAELPINVEGIPVTLHETYLFGGFSPDGSMLGDGILSAQADVRDIATMMGYSADEICAMLESYMDLSCTECSSDAEAYCIGMRVEEIEGERVDGLEVMPVTTIGKECDDTPT